MNTQVKQVFDQCPHSARMRLEQLRQLIFNIRDEHGLGEIEETLKWGEPTYKVKGGSPVRLAWKTKNPDVVYLFFICTTSLVETFRELYSGTLAFEGKRAIVLPLNQDIQEQAVAHCITLAMTYQDVKHLPLLGA